MTSRGPTLRGLAQRVHRWLGLSLGLWFAFLGLSGAVLVFWHALEDASYPDTPLAEGPALPLENLLARLKALRPGADIFRIYLPEASGSPARLEFFGNRPGTEEVFRASAFMDPASGALLGERVFGEAWIHTLYMLHTGLILERPGIVAFGLIGLVLALLPILGILLWRYRDRRALIESLIPVPGLRSLRRLRNLHRSIGIWAALPLLVTAITGAGLAFPEVVRDLAQPFFGAPEPVRHRGPATAGLAAAMARAEELLPGFRTAWIELPIAGSGEPTTLILRPIDGRLSGPGVAVLDPEWPKQIEVTLASPVETLRAWIMGLHNGVAFGLAHRLFVVALGFAPLALSLLGWLAWRRRMRARRLAAMPRMAEPAGE